MSLELAIFVAAINGYTLSPQIRKSSNYKHWVSVEDLKRCFLCADNHGKIWLISAQPFLKPPIHLSCRCLIEVMKAILAGTATIHGINGADFQLKYNGNLPACYISLKDLKDLGWKKGKTISSFVFGKLLTKGVYKNNNGHLPQKPGRVWYEADINYIFGKRNSQRILWSNDGLIFVTYDHYKTFFEIY